jgi:hypothetical protein
MIALADKEGFIDETISALARRFNVSEESVNNAVNIFLNPDKRSRTPSEDGKRLCKIRESFGWQIINYQYYRDLRTSQDRTDYMKDYMKSYRKKRKQESLHDVNCKHDVNTLANTDTDTDTDINTSLSELLVSLIKKNNPKFKQPNIKTWSKHIGKMIRIDKRDPKDIKEMIEWCQADTFWQSNILCTEKLREKYDQLVMKMKNPKPEGHGLQNQQRDWEDVKREKEDE